MDHVRLPVDAIVCEVGRAAQNGLRKPVPLRADLTQHDELVVEDRGCSASALDRVRQAPQRGLVLVRLGIVAPGVVDDPYLGAAFGSSLDCLGYRAKLVFVDGDIQRPALVKGSIDDPKNPIEKAAREPLQRLLGDVGVGISRRAGRLERSLDRREPAGECLARGRGTVEDHDVLGGRTTQGPHRYRGSLLYG
jgi:hypothetical protein